MTRMRGSVRVLYDLIRDKIKVKHLNDEYIWRLVKRIMDEDDNHLSDRLLKCFLSKRFNTDLDKDFLKLIKHLNIQKLKTDHEQAGIHNLLGFLYQKFDMDTLEKSIYWQFCASTSSRTVLLASRIFFGVSAQYGSVRCA
jgi:hypothetical protein